jgi:hypothetical protein
MRSALAISSLAFDRLSIDGGVNVDRIASSLSLLRLMTEPHPARDPLHHLPLSSPVPPSSQPPLPEASEAEHCVEPEAGEGPPGVDDGGDSRATVVAPRHQR